MFGWSLFRRVNRERVPFNAVIAVSVFSLVSRSGAVRQEQHPVRHSAITGSCTVRL
jgi:hypothetical protein